MRHLTGYALVHHDAARSLVQAWGKDAVTIECEATAPVPTCYMGLVPTALARIRFDTRGATRLLDRHPERDNMGGNPVWARIDPAAFAKMTDNYPSRRLFYLSVLDHDRQQRSAGVYGPKRHKLRLIPSEAPLHELARQRSVVCVYPHMDAQGNPLLVMDEATSHVPDLKLARQFLTLRRDLFDAVGSVAPALLEHLL